MTIDQSTGGNIEPRGLEEEMRSSYLDYAMSVIIGRALPDVRDGLKPVHRRMLFAMHELGPRSRTGRTASAPTIVGDVMGNYHPHGDPSIYDTLVRMAQDFTMRYPLVDGQGNFGSVDGDPPAAMRYTEARLTRARRRDAARHRQGHGRLRAQLRRVAPGADGPAGALPEPAGQRLRRHRGRHGHQHPAAQPARGRSTRVVACIDNPSIDVDGPDEASSRARTSRPAASSSAAAASRDAYATGRGRVVDARPRAHRAATSRARQAIIVTEIPYQVNKGDGAATASA